MTIKDLNEQINKVPGEDRQPAGGTRGEDDGSTEIEGDDRHLHEDQKAPAVKPSQARGRVAD